jgi:hypothetical protein
MAVATPCQTSGAIFGIHIKPNKVTVVVHTVFALEIDTEEEAKILEANIHNAMELVLKPYWKK